YIPKALPLTDRPEERMQLTCGMYGDGDFFTMKGVINEVIGELGLKGKIVYKNDCELEYLHPGRRANVYYNDTFIAYVGEVHPQVLKNYEIGDRAYLAMLDLNAVEELLKSEAPVRYEGIAKFPASTRDLSLIMKKSTLAGDVEDIIKSNGGSFLKNIELFDIYEGHQLTEGFKSLSFKLTFMAEDRTLVDDEVNQSIDKVLKALDENGVKLRQ
ncbi:MAG: phenylalanine--tRNA ligase subunit beta, partial [Lachnospiraceae bacterium]|nr:phenylalanine--tRNA ligase subunit beta [Lachnospiraceae bacterium]